MQEGSIVVEAAIRSPISRENGAVFRDNRSDFIIVEFVVNRFLKTQ